MSEQDEKRLDDQLALITDQLTGNQTQKSSSSEDPALAPLEQIIRKLHENTPQPSPDSANKIKENTQKEWERLYQQPAHSPILDKLAELLGLGPKTGYQSRKHKQQILVARLAALAVAVVVMAAIILPFTGLPDGSTAGAATGNLGLWLPLVILCLAGIAGLWYWLKNKN